METKDNHTPGPYGIRVSPDNRHDTEIYSESTGEKIARVMSRDAHGGAPEDQTALRNAALLQAAPKLHASLGHLLSAQPEQARAETEASARKLLAQIAAGPGETFLREREQERQDFERLLQAQVDEMSQQSSRSEEMPDDDEDSGHSF